MTLKTQRYNAEFCAVDGGTPIYSAVCAGKTSGKIVNRRYIAKHSAVDGGTPIFAISDCDFPQIGRYLMRFVAVDVLPVFALACCDFGSSGSSGSGSSGSGSSGSGSLGSGSSGSGSGSGSSGSGSSGSGSSGSGSGSGSSGSGSGLFRVADCCPYNCTIQWDGAQWNTLTECPYPLTGTARCFCDVNTAGGTVGEIRSGPCCVL